MSDNFDDDLYNVYNGAGKEDTYNDEDLYGEDPVEFKEEDVEVKVEASPEPENDDNDDNQNEQQSTQQKHQQQQQGNWGYQPNAYQQYMAAYQRSFQQQMVANPYQMQQMIQRQMRQQMPQQQQQQQQQHFNKSKQQYQQHDDDDTGESSDEKLNKPTASNSDEGKMFIGGLNWETTDENLRQYFSQFGEVLDCVVMRDPTTHRSRGFGFLTMKDNSAIDKIVSQDHHNLDGKRIDPKRAIPRDEQDKTEKIFVGGISPEVNEEEFREFFTQFGKVLDATLMMERDTGRPRGFGFVTFEDSKGVEEALKNPNLSIKDKIIEVKKAMPKGKQNRQHNGPVFNPNFRPPYMPNNRYNGNGNFNSMRGNFNMYNNMYPGGNYNMAAAAAAAAAYYGQQQQQGGGYNNNMYNNMRQQHHRQDDNRGDNRRNSRDRHQNNGAIHPSHSRSQQHHRPY
ncbi:hypothetical protein BD408DRAFT_418525 [Parasitella parasitica]|nr:hypothetical protein BD408DRAFT_418525 [Parasitella parasitica]